jgi:hypothetical protein
LISFVLSPRIIEATDMRKWMVSGVLLLGGCAAMPNLVPTPITAHLPTPARQAVTAIELEYIQKFLVPSTAYTLLPRCPQPPDIACGDPSLVARLRAAQVKVHDAIYAARDLTDAAPDADASALLADARASLHAAEALVPQTGGKP